MKVIGILGGVASGKSLVAEQLRDLGAEVINADQLGHEVLLEDEVVQAVRERWGDEVVAADGRLDRSAIAKRVFADGASGERELAFLEQLTHPRIGNKIQQRLNELRESGAFKAVILDAPVMLKSGWDRYCDRILFVETSREIRLDRARQRGWTDDEFAAREASQTPIEAKRAASDYTIDNSGTVEMTRQQIESFWQTLD